MPNNELPARRGFYSFFMPSLNGHKKTLSVSYSVRNDLSDQNCLYSTSVIHP